MTNRFQDFAQLLNAAEADFGKFYDKEVNAAGTRVRKQLQALVVLCKEVRKEITAIKTERKQDKPTE